MSKTRPNTTVIIIKDCHTGVTNVYKQSGRYYYRKSSNRYHTTNWCRVSAAEYESAQRTTAEKEV